MVADSEELHFIRKLVEAQHAQIVIRGEQLTETGKALEQRKIAEEALRRSLVVAREEARKLREQRDAWYRSPAFLMAVGAAAAGLATLAVVEAVD